VSVKPFADRLLQWWDVHGRKDLPWQHPRTPYRVWVSEIMLQQTQVTTVIPYFERFMKRFPDLETLAGASQDEVLAQWAGLGYYARGRNLQMAAMIVSEQFAGKLPQTQKELSSLPGIGESTANAIISQAWDVPATVVDGNVRRVMARHAGIDASGSKTAAEKQYWATSTALLPKSRGADYTQAIMDLGATLCTRSNPDCKTCPVNQDCYAFINDEVANYPAKATKIKITEKQLHMLILSNNDGHILLEKRPPAGIWGGLWSLPEAEDEQALASRFGFRAGQLTTMPDVEHRLTHMRINIRPRTIRAEPKFSRIESADEQRWFTEDEWASAGLPKPVMNLLQKHQKELQNDTNG
jgi:A/G-specific adenine glycosylase